ncbi:MAG: fumarylacetoacetate hydrolase family protein [Hydrogenophaga sp.]|nr:fumarylacetoacetate hydrolase family protein [Hydrogenophaga sp.]
MKLMSYLHAGLASYGAWTPAGIHDLGGQFRVTWPDLQAVIASDAALALARHHIEQGAKTYLDAADIVTLPLLSRPAKIFCIGVNYADHAQETQIAAAPHPTVFMRFADSQVGHGQPLVMPMESEQLDFEGEMAVVIGRGGRRIPREKAWEHVVGCACYNDASVRDWQFHSSQWGPGKNFHHTGAFGPWLVTRDEVDPSLKPLTLTTRLNGEVMQQASTEDMLFDVPALIAYCSTLLPLQPGDVIVTGTPAGVGMSRQPPLYLQAGDVVEVEITGLGCLRNTVVRG